MMWAADGERRSRGGGSKASDTTAASYKRRSGAVPRLYWPCWIR